MKNKIFLEKSETISISSYKGYSKKYKSLHYHF